MRGGSLTELINKYSYIVSELSGKSAYEEIDKSMKDFKEQVRELNTDKVEEEMIAYLNENIASRKWDNADYWIPSAHEHPSVKYIDIFNEVLQTEDSEIILYWVLDVIAYMPDEISEHAVPGLRKLMANVNPNWTESIIEKYFETLVWCDEQAEEFIATLVDSSNDMIAFRANYWMVTFEVEREEEGEGSPDKE